MLKIKCLRVSVQKQLLFVACLVCVVATAANGQSVKISDADVNLLDLVGVSETLSPGAGVESVGGLGSPTRREKPGRLNRERRTSGEAALRNAIHNEAARYRIDPDLVFALVWQESRWDLRAISPKQARGPLQLMPETAERYGVVDPHEPNEAARGGVAYLVWLLDRYGGNVSLALAGYNAGPSAVDAYLSGKRIVLRGGKVINAKGRRTDGIPPYQETQNYVRRIAERYRLIRAERQAASTIVQ
jgi:soluble lytic murein transglycosylase-like protein